MKTININVKSKAAYLIPICDAHIGDPGFNEPKLKAYINWVMEKKNCFIVLLGDIFETPVPGQKSTNSWLMKDGLTPVEAENRGLEIFAPARDRIVGIVEGNHELRASKILGLSSLQRLADHFGLSDYFDSKVITIKIVVNGVEYNVIATHGWGGARLLGGQMNKVASMSGVTGDADVYLTGHEHSLILARHEVDLVREGIELRQVYVGCGCFVDWTEFQQGIQRAKPSLGAPRIRFDGNRRDVHVSI